MVAVLKDPPDFLLPRRPDASRGPADTAAARMALADRIADLPGILAVDNGIDPLPVSVSVYLRNDHAPRRLRAPRMVLCDISRDGIRVHGLDLPARRSVLASGWGTESGDHVQVFLPRDDDEVDVCWAILARAHRSLMDISARLPAARQVTHRDLPRFSRTTLQ